MTPRFLGMPALLSQPHSGENPVKTCSYTVPLRMLVSSRRTDPGHVHCLEHRTLPFSIKKLHPKELLLRCHILLILLEVTTHNFAHKASLLITAMFFLLMHQTICHHWIISVLRTRGVLFTFLSLRPGTQVSSINP